jgi:Flp pilus assembly protein TadD
MRRAVWSVMGVVLGASLVGCRSSRSLSGDASAAPATVGEESALARALRLERSADHEAAWSAYHDALHDDPSCAIAEHRLGVLCDRKGQFEEAEDHYRRAMNLMGDDADSYNDLGYSYYLRGRLGDAEEMLHKCLSLDSGHQRGHANLGIVLARQGRPDESLAEFRKAGQNEEQAAVSLRFAHGPLESGSDAGSRLAGGTNRLTIAGAAIEDAPPQPRAGTTLSRSAAPVQLLNDLEHVR